jgi:hypothetical protein
MPGVRAGHFALKRRLSHNSDTGNLMLPMFRQNHLEFNGFNLT